MAQKTTCWRCKCVYYLPDELYTAAKASEGISFFCPYGHEAHFPVGETEEMKLRRERDLLKQRIAQKDDEIAEQRQMCQEAERSAAAQKGQATRIRNRVKNGVCPCCNRSFVNLHKHMETEHPDFGNAEKAA